MTTEDCLLQSKATMPLIRAVLFDYGMVLSGPPDPVAWQRMRTLLDASEKSFHAAYWRPRLEYDRGTFDGAGFWREVAGDLGRPLRADVLDALLELDVDLWTVPNPPMIAWAMQLQRERLRTGILSNIGDAMEDGILRRCPWMSGFAHSTFSHRLGLVKPEAGIYRHAVDGLGAVPEETLFIDDREENVEGARACGLHALQYRDHGSFLQALGAAGVDGLPLPAER